MHGLMTEEMGALITTEATVRETRHRERSEERSRECRPLWLTQREAESLLVLCAASPVSAGPAEQELFLKLGDFFRSLCR